MKRKFCYSLKIIVFFLLAVAVDYIFVVISLRNKFHDLTIELGTKEITINEFVNSRFYLDKSKFVTDIDKIDFNEVGEYDITLLFGDDEQTVKLEIVDTTPPEVEFQDLVVGLDYEYNVEDFVVVARDLSDYEISADIENFETKLGKFNVNVTVSDIYGNKVSKICLLDVGIVRPLIKHELGETLDKSEILLSEQYGGNELTKNILNTVNINEVGEYELIFVYDGVEYVSKIIVEDTLGPEIVVNNLTCYPGTKQYKNEDFVKSVTDPSGVKEVIYEGEFDTNALGVYEIKIIAIDNLGHSSEAVATLNVKDDLVGPVFSGLTAITIKKGTAIDYLKGVKAVDAKDGAVEFSVDASKVKNTVAGTYYAIYTAKDKSNNVTTKQRKIVVNYDAQDVEDLFDDYFNKYLVGKSIKQMTQYIRTHIGYSHTRGTDPLYRALTQKIGSCYGHAIFLKKALDKLGIPNYLVQTTDGTHYWNLVYDNGVWRHYDSTPTANPDFHPVGPLTDAEKQASEGLDGVGRTWDKSLYPVAN